MKKSRFTESKIIKLLREHENGRSAADIFREQGIAKPTFYSWRKKYSCMDAQQLKRLKELKRENQRLKQISADLSLDHKILKEVLEIKL